MSHITHSNSKDACTAGIYQFRELLGYDFLHHGVSTRHGGVSASRLTATLNLGLKTCDSADMVLENYRRFCGAAGLTFENSVHASQTHSSNVRIVTKEDAGKGLFRKRDYDDVDALVTKEKNIPLIITTADCVPILFVDIKNKIIGAAHCGWRGTFSDLAGKTTEAMVGIGADAGSIVAAICPCAGSCCYEVSKELADKFYEKYNTGICIRGNSCYLDLPRINRLCLINSGLADENIIECGICTICNSNDFFSHRVMGDGRGMIASALELI